MASRFNLILLAGAPCLVRQSRESLESSSLSSLHRGGHTSQGICSHMLYFEPMLVFVIFPQGVEENVAKGTLSLLKLLPSVHCISPRDVWKTLETGNTGCKCNLHMFQH